MITSNKELLNKNWIGNFDFFSDEERNNCCYEKNKLIINNILINIFFLQYS